MMETIALIGTKHEYQTQSLECQPEDAQAFQRFLSEKCRQYGIKTVAEEMSKQALEETKEAWERYKKELESKDPKAWPEELEGNEAKLKRCEDALKWHKKGMSIPQRVAKELSLKHLFCDPNMKERTERGIFQENYLRVKSFPNPPMPEDEIKRQLLEGDRRREQYWLERLLTEPEVEWPVLFICGACHVESFSRILENKGFIVEHIEDDWAP